MKKYILISFLFLSACQKELSFTPVPGTADDSTVLPFFPANDARIYYQGRFDMSNKLSPKVTAGGGYMYVAFVGSSCQIKVGDQKANTRNWITYAVDGKATRIKLSAASNIITISGLSVGTHYLVVMKDSEASVGYISFDGIYAADIKSGPIPSRKVAFIGDSQTAGSASDVSVFPCGTGLWYDQANAYDSYGAITTRALNADFQLSGISGIGLTRSYGGGPTIDKLYDYRDFTPASPLYDHSFHPNAIGICLGQNDMNPADGPLDSATFVNHYKAFIAQIRAHDPNAILFLITSPMSSPSQPIARYIDKVCYLCNASGDWRVYTYHFSKMFSGGCGGHPNLASHQAMAAELTPFIKAKMAW